MQDKAEWLGIRVPVWLSALFCLLLASAALHLHNSRSIVENPPGAITHPVPIPRQRSAIPTHPGKALTTTPQAMRQNPSSPGTKFVPPSTTWLMRLSDPDPSVRLGALEHLVTLDLPTSELVPHLTACLNDREPRIRAFAATELGFISMAASEAVPVLKQLAEFDADERVRDRAKDALYNIRLYDFPLRDF
jgi:hypothetical protein